MPIETNNDNKTTPKYSRRNQLEQIVPRLSREQLEHFLLETALRDIELRESLLIHFGEYLNTSDPEEAKYRETLQRMIARHQNQSGFINLESAQKLSAMLESLLESARQATTPPSKTIDLCMAMIGVMPTLGDHMDDSEGHIYRLMRITCVVLWECFSVLPPENQAVVFNRLLSEYANPVYLDLDLDSFMLTLLKDLAKSNREWQKACLRQQDQLLKEVKNDKWRKNYLLEQLNDLLGTWHKK
ncbi:hypothetical protein [uncultured Thiothrix sp.]|jgi:hypothetical protein|uniref:hypothetical protein n=1 Tax=uncultured Thiothrix sp. TaxID=223185 RepID=UPI002623A3E1|nr:hypothetical protein [uncultured Thiothrix sp.]HMT91800.1 hypothetical protein [Thiolinea sp.]